MRTVASAIWSVPRAIGHGIWRFSSLVHNWDEVSETYGANPEGATDQQIAASNLAANMIGGNAIGGM